MDLRAPAAASADPGETAATPAPAAKRASIRDWSTTKMTRTLRLVNLCNGIMLITTGILLLIVGAVSISFTSVTVSAYVVFFGLLLSCLECNISALAPRFHRNFGFMYSFLGRALFLIFAGTMVFAMNQIPTSWIVGAGTILNGFFNGYVICVHPSFKTGELQAAGDPYGGYTGGETEMLDYLKKNPQLAQQAGASAAAFAAANPGVAAQALAGAAPSGAAAAAASPWGQR